MLIPLAAGIDPVRATAISIAASIGIPPVIQHPSKCDDLMIYGPGVITFSDLAVIGADSMIPVCIPVSPRDH